MGHPSVVMVLWKTNIMPLRGTLTHLSKEDRWGTRKKIADVRDDGEPLDQFPLTTQIGVVFGGPVGAGRGEDVKIDGVFQSLSAVGNVGRYAERFSRIERDGFAFQDEAHLAG